MLFYELYIYADQNSQAFYPVPVRISNVKNTANVQPNTNPSINNLCDPTNVLVKRFFLIDLVSGLSSSSTSTSTTSAGSTSNILPIVMRYASQITLEVSKQVQNQIKIFPPVLTITYTEITPPILTSTSTSSTLVTYNVKGTFTMNLGSFTMYLLGFFIAGMVIFALLFILTYLNWNTRNSRSISTTTSTTSLGGLNYKILIDMSIMLIQSFVYIFFPFTVLICWYIFVFFKIQTVPAILLPTIDNLYSTTSHYYPFTIILHLLAFGQLGFIVSLVHKQANADIFFLDWEPVKNRNRKVNTFNTTNPNNTNNTNNDKDKNGNVSIWRTILVANEYAEMQTMRKTDIKFTLFFLVLILIGRYLF